MSFPALAESIGGVADDSAGHIKEEERMKLLEACENLERALERLLDATVRIMLAGMGIFEEVGHNTLTPTPLAGAYVTGSPLADGVIHVVRGRIVAFSNAHHSFLTSGQPRWPNFPGCHTTSRKEASVIPTDAFDGPFQCATETKLRFFDWLRSHPKDQKSFNAVMSISALIGVMSGMNITL